MEEGWAEEKCGGGTGRWGRREKSVQVVKVNTQTNK